MKNGPFQYSYLKGEKCDRDFSRIKHSSLIQEGTIQMNDTVDTILADRSLQLCQPVEEVNRNVNNHSRATSHQLNSACVETRLT